MLLVGDRLYAAQNGAVGYYSLADGSFSALCEIDLNPLYSMDCQAVYAEGRLILRFLNALVSIDTATGDCVDITQLLGVQIPHDILTLNGRIYFSGANGGLISANYDGSDAQSIAVPGEDSARSFWFRRSYGPYVFADECVYRGQGSDARDFEPTEMQRTALASLPAYSLGDRVYVESDACLDGHPDIRLYDSYGLEEYISLFAK